MEYNIGIGPPRPAEKYLINGLINGYKVKMVKDLAIALPLRCRSCRNIRIAQRNQFACRKACSLRPKDKISCSTDTAIRKVVI